MVGNDNLSSQLAGLDKYKHGKLVEFLSTTFKSVELGGKQVIQTPDGEFIEYVLMDEQYFLDNWLVQFAVGVTGNANYFNHEQWSKYTQQFTKGVIVINKDKLPTLIIRKFIDMDLSFQQQHLVDNYVRPAANAKFIPDEQEVDAIVTNVAMAIEQITAQNPDYDTLTAMIPMEYYLAHGVDPLVVKQVIWIRDNYTYQGEAIAPDSEVLARIEEILYKNARGELISFNDKEFVEEVTNGEFIFNTEPNKVGDKVSNQKSSQEDEGEFDPYGD